MSLAPLDHDVRQAYLARLGVEPEPPSPGALRRLVQAHAERVPYETLWIQAGEGWGIDPHDAAARIAHQQRGGYCYHLNGALGLLLTSLGYDVRAHVGGVHGPEGPSAAVRGNHLVLTVAGLPDEAAPDGTWYVDAGLGDALHSPVPLVAGAVTQPPFAMTLEQTHVQTGAGTEAAGWHLVHDSSGGFTGMSWTDALASTADFEAQHQQLSTSPESGFVRVAMAERRDATGVDVVRGLVLSRIETGSRTDEQVTDRSAWFGLLAERFALPLRELAPEGRDRLWGHVLAAHRRWEQQQAAPRP